MPARALTRGERRRLDLAYQPGFRTIAYFCVALLYAPVLILVAFASTRTARSPPGRASA